MQRRESKYSKGTKQSEVSDLPINEDPPATAEQYKQWLLRTAAYLEGLEESELSFNTYEAKVIPLKGCARILCTLADNWEELSILQQDICCAILTENNSTSFLQQMS